MANIMHLSRRSFLGGAAAFGASALIPQTNKPQRIDVHHHITPPAFLSFLAANGQGRPIEWTLSKSQSSNPIAMRALRSVVPVSQIVFGTDYPYRSTSEHVKGLITGKVFSAQELQAIDRDNAVRLLPRYRS